MKIAHFGTFDVENYGDLLFPLILERRLSDVCEEIVHVSPVGGPPIWEDCAPTVGFDEFLETSGDIDGVIIGGGQIVRTAATSLEIYDRGGVSAFTTYPSVWLGAAYAAARQNVPLCWNVPGVSPDFGPVAARLVEWTASVTDYLAVRDETSRRSLEEAGVSRDISVAPDSALEVSGLWDEGEISAAYRKVFASRNRSVPGRTIAFHVNSRWMGEEAAIVAARIDRICKKVDAAPILLAIGPCHGDGEVQRQVSREMRADPLVVDRPQSLLEVTACIARSEAYFGSSLHGMIAACSFGTRGALVASKEDNKYSGFLDHLDLTSWLVESWDAAEQRADELFATPGDHWKRALDTARPILEDHWGRLGDALASGGREAPRFPDKRPAVDRLYLINEEHSGTPKIFRALVAEGLQENHAKLQAMRERLWEESEKLREERRRLKATRQNLALLRRWMIDVDRVVRELFVSRQWKAVRLVGEVRRRVLPRSGKWGAPEQLSNLLKQFRMWNEEFEQNKKLERSEKEHPDP